MAEPEQKCSRCEKKLDTDGSPRWCKVCRATYQREYRALVTEMANGKGFLAGAEAMRDALVAKLAEMHPSTMLRAAETADWLAKFPAPRPS